VVARIILTFSGIAVGEGEGDGETSATGVVVGVGEASVVVGVEVRGGAVEVTAGVGEVGVPQPARSIRTRIRLTTDKNVVDILRANLPRVWCDNDIFTSTPLSVFNMYLTCDR